MSIEEIRNKLYEYRLSRRAVNLIIRCGYQYNTFEDVIDFIKSGKIKDYYGVGERVYQEMLTKLCLVEEDDKAMDLNQVRELIKNATDTELRYMMTYICKEMDKRFGLPEE